MESSDFGIPSSRPWMASSGHLDYSFPNPCSLKIWALCWKPKSGQNGKDGALLSSQLDSKPRESRLSRVVGPLAESGYSLFIFSFQGQGTQRAPAHHLHPPQVWKSAVRNTLLWRDNRVGTQEGLAET